MDRLTALAEPGGPHEDTLLLVFGDHGQVFLTSLPMLPRINTRRLVHQAGWMPDVQNASCFVLHIVRSSTAYLRPRCMAAADDNICRLVALLFAQTLGGDHGGGSPDEVDSALLAVDVARLRALRAAAQTMHGRRQPPAALRAPVMPQVCRSDSFRSPFLTVWQT